MDGGGGGGGYITRGIITHRFTTHLRYLTKNQRTKMEAKETKLREVVCKYCLCSKGEHDYVASCYLSIRHMPWAVCCCGL